MRTAFLLFWTSLLAAGTAAQELNFEATTFYPVNGQDVYEGGADADARARLLSDGQQLYLEVDVTDDKVVTGPGELSGDRVEVWFALPSADGVDAPAPAAQAPVLDPFGDAPAAEPPVYVMPIAAAFTGTTTRPTSTRSGKRSPTPTSSSAGKSTTTPTSPRPDVGTGSKTRWIR